MNAGMKAAPDAAALPSPSQCVGGAGALTTAMARTFRRAGRAFAAARERARVAALPRRDRRGDWQTAARERYLDCAVDRSDLERRQRAWERDESNAYSMAGWS